MCSRGTPDPVVVVVNGDNYSLSRFTERYKDFLTATSLPDNLRSRHIFTDALIDEILFLAWADSTVLLTSTRHQRELRDMEDQLLLNRLYQAQVRDKIAVSEELFRETYRWSKNSLHTRHLFAGDRQTADNLYQRLMAGERWADLARETFRDPVLAGNGGDLGFTRLGDLDPAYEVVAYQLADGEISPPVMTRTGYSIIQVLERKYDPFLIEEEFQAQKARLRQVIMSHLKRPSVRAYTDSVLTSLNVRFPSGGPGPMSNQLSLLTSSTDDYQVYDLDAPFVEFNGPKGFWTVGEVLERIRQLSSRQQRQIDSEENLRRVVAGLVVQDRLLSVARAYNFEAEPEFRQTSQRAKKSYRISQVLHHIWSHAQPDESELRDYYREHESELKSEPRYEIMEIVAADPDTAAMIHQRLQLGESFGELARRYSLRKETAQYDGYLGWGTPSQFGGLKSALLEADKGDIIGPTQLAGMEVIVKVLDKKPSTSLTFQEARPLIEQRLAAQTNRRAYDSFRNQLRASAAVKIDSALIRGFILPRDTS